MIKRKVVLCKGLVNLGILYNIKIVGLLKMNKIFAYMFLLLLSLSVVYAVAVTDNVGFLLSPDGSTGGINGMRFITNQDLNLTAVYRYPLADCAQSYLWDSAHNLLASEGFNINGKAIYNYPLEEQTQYYVVCDSNGSGYTLYDSYGGYGAISYPINGVHINYTAGWLGGDAYNYAVNIWNVTTSNTSEEVIEEYNITLCSNPQDATYTIYNATEQIINFCIISSWANNSGMDFYIKNVLETPFASYPIGVPSVDSYTNEINMTMQEVINSIPEVNFSNADTTILWNVGYEYPNMTGIGTNLIKIRFNFATSQPPKTLNPINTTVLITILGILMVIALVIGLFIAFTGENEASAWLQKYFILAVILVIIILLITLMSAF
jgi:hypothetical protein